MNRTRPQTRNAIGKKPHVVLLMAPEAGYDRDLLCGIARYAALHGPWVFHLAGDYPGLPLPQRESVSVFSTAKKRSGATRSRLSFRDLKSRGVTGMIGRIQSPEMARRLLELKVPFVAMDPTAPGVAPGNPMAEVPEIFPDSRKAGRLAAEHLLDRGFYRFGYCGYAGRLWSQQRLEGFRERVEEAGCSCEVYEPPRQPSRQSWDREGAFVCKWLRSLAKPMGVMACNDTRGLQLLEACLLSEIRVPDDVAVVGVDDDELSCDLSNPPLSSVALNAEWGGYRVAELLDKLMSGHEPDCRQIVVDALDVVARRSTDVIAVEDPEVAAALNFIRENARWPIGTEDVVGRSTLARRSLEIRFRRSLGRSIREEIQRTRLALTKQFLAETSLPMWKIAEASGFNSLTYLDRVFKREAGLTLRQYRAQYRKS